MSALKQAYQRYTVQEYLALEAQAADILRTGRKCAFGVRNDLRIVRKGWRTPKARFLAIDNI